VLWGAVLAVGGLIVAASMFPLRGRLPETVRRAVLAVGGAGVGLGAIGLQDHPTTVEWILTPLVLGALGVLHDRLLFAGEGPRRI
jgi:hypothetical protein